MRRQPVAFFLGDAAFLSDAKFRALARRLPDPDDFNSAVGAYWVALAAARRNGSPDLDVAGETASRFLPDLVAVGLLTESGFPEVAFRSWAPSRPKYPSDTRTPDAPSAPNDSEGSEPSVSSASALPTPPLLPSIPIPSTPRRVGVKGEGLPNLNSAVATIWEEATGRSVLASGQFAQDYLDDACLRHPPSEVGAAIIRARRAFDHIPAAQPLVVAVRAILDPLPDRKKAGQGERERQERAASRRRTEATLAGIHKNGGHEAEPRVGCPMCEAVSA